MSQHTTVDYLKDLSIKGKNNSNGLVSCLVLQRTFNPPSKKTWWVFFAFNEEITLGCNHKVTFKMKALVFSAKKKVR